VLDGIRQLAIAFSYIDENPVKAGLVDRACDWRHGGAWHSRMGDSSILDKGMPWISYLEAFRQLPLAIASGRGS
jgi:hypothetical protein